MNIYVRNLNFSLEEPELEQIFRQFGEVSSVKIIKDKFTGRAKGFGFVEMPNEQEGLAAIEKLNGNMTGYNTLVTDHNIALTNNIIETLSICGFMTDQATSPSCQASDSLIQVPKLEQFLGYSRPSNVSGNKTSICSQMIP